MSNENKHQADTTTSSPLTDVLDLQKSPKTNSDDSESDSDHIVNQKSYSSNSAQEEDGVMLPDRKRAVPFDQLNQQDRSGRTLIFKYAARGDVETTESLLQAGASLQITDHAGWTPLHEACLEGHTEIVQLMLLYNADVDAPGGSGDTPLHDAIGNFHVEVVKLLLNFGASIDLTNEDEQNALTFAKLKLSELKVFYN
jgi:ankyrin repeat protein